jgi:hypothetical protein
MKKLIIPFSCLVLLSQAYTAFAQNDGFKELPAIVVSAAASNVEVSTRLNRAFQNFFKDASQLQWYEVNKYFLVKFIQDDREHRALFTKSGELIYHISYGTEDFLPADIRKLVKSSYYDQSITRVLKVNQDKRTIWVVSMEDNHEYVMARVEDMELEETKRMTKSN